MTKKKKFNKFSFETRAIREGSFRSSAMEHSEAVYPTSSFLFNSASQAASRFKGDEDGVIYSRFSNPSIEMFEKRLASLENAEDCIATATGMSAILLTCLSFLKSGDEIVSTPSLFGATLQLFNNYLSKFGIKTHYVSLTKTKEWEEKITAKTKLIYLETPSNPLNEIADLFKISEISKKNKIISVVDNCLCTPALQNPLDFSIDLSLHSATKFIDGQGRVLGGAVTGKKKLISQIKSTMRTCGPAMSPFNAWVLFKSLETLKIRMDAQSESAEKIATFLQNHNKIQKVFFPGLKSHPQYKLAKKQQKKPGAVISFEIKNPESLSAKKNAWNIINQVNIFSITGNFGDCRSTITHPASTTHCRITNLERKKAGINNGLIRISIGLENVNDLINDLDQALEN